MTRAPRALGFAAVLLLLGAAVWTTAARLDRSRQAGDGSSPVYLPRAEYLRPMSLGWANVLADVLWFRAISYFGEHYRSDRTYPWLAHMCDLVTDLDPKAAHVYRFAGVILPWEAEQVEAGIRLLEKGTRAFPDSWVLHYYLGFNHYFFRDDPERAIESLDAAARLPGAHESVARLAAVLAAHQYGPETTLGFLEELERNVESAEVRDVVRRQQNEARLAADLARIDAAIAAYREREGKPAPSVRALADAGFLPAIPRDPFGGSYEIDPETGAARSASGRQPSRLHQSKKREKLLRGESLRAP
jgi:tetratricopeptide (TPR) repeat protein